ncbi:hypothetical protein DEJ50_18010 [Streptomyces venezuelae]|uniref:Uncharacterized protein n=1 Tax=Streptomyces venezuelae TaxID=54571 RepID=A0A5P2D2P0_STRVZ|nr:hypothetical protein [Streptomyces venezuelae]QES49422.1 hypothetical protein DEJ50_18010 [Streptomyces venezuelae]
MPFEDEVGAALRRTGDGFATDQQALVDRGEQRGRRLVARRRVAAVTGTVLTMAVIGGIGAYSGGWLGGGEAKGGGANVATAPSPADSPVQREEDTVGAGRGAVTAAQMVATFKSLLPGGTFTDTLSRGTDSARPGVSGLYDDGKGKAAIGLSLSRIAPAGTMARQMTQCPDKEMSGYDSCTSEKLADGSQLLLYRGYEYPDRRVDTKLWRATLATPQGFLVDVSEWNSPAEKGEPVSRPNPPLTLAQMKTLVTSGTWHAALNDLPAARPEKPGPGLSGGPEAGPILLSLLPNDGISVVGKGGQGDYAYAVLDDGKGKSLVQVNAQPGMGDAAGALFGSGDVTTLPDGTKVKVEKKPGEKGGAGVVWWTVDTLRPDGMRVVVSAFNTGNQNKPATRTNPLLTIEQLKAIALSPKWLEGAGS